MTNARKKDKTETTTFIAGDLVLHDARSDGRDAPLQQVGRVMLVEQNQLVLKLPSGSLCIALAQHCKLLNI